MNNPHMRVPIPAARRWRLIRRSLLPVAAFAVAVVLAGLLWHQNMGRPSFHAQAERIQAELRSPQAGELRLLTAGLLGEVRKGQALAKLGPANPGPLRSGLEVLRRELEYLKAGSEPVLGQERVALECSRLRLEWMKERVVLATLKSELEDAETRFQRLDKMREGGSSSEELHTQARQLRDGLRRQVTEQQQLVERVGHSVENLGHQTDSQAKGRQEATLAAGLRLQEEKIRELESLLEPIILYSPMDGVVTLLHRQPGEQVLAGEPILQISGPRSEAILAYLKTPLTSALKCGSRVRLRSLRTQGQSADSEVLQLGSSLEQIPLSFLPALRASQNPEFGLPVRIRMPAGLDLLPGENVEVFLMPERS